MEKANAKHVHFLKKKKHYSGQLCRNRRIFLICFLLVFTSSSSLSRPLFSRMRGVKGKKYAFKKTFYVLQYSTGKHWKKPLKCCQECLFSFLMHPRLLNLS